MAALARANGASGRREAATAIGAARSSAPGTERPSWREALAPYARPHLGRSLLGIATSLVPYLALSVLMYLALDVSYLLVLALAIPAAGFLLRTYIVFHDCAHGSFLPSKRANAWLGAVLGAGRVQVVPRAGDTVTPSTTPPPVTSTGAESATSTRLPSRSTGPRRGAAGSGIACFETRS